MVEVEVFGARLVPDAPSLAEVERLCVLAAASAGVKDGHLAIEFVDAERIARLNAEYRGKEGPTDVLSFPIDGAGDHGGVVCMDGVEPRGDGELRGGAERSGGVPRELGDVAICPEHTADLREAIVHGVLHLVGMDHETDAGEMLALQAELLADGHTARRAGSGTGTQSAGLGPERLGRAACPRSRRSPIDGERR